MTNWRSFAFGRFGAVVGAAVIGVLGVGMFFLMSSPSAPLSCWEPGMTRNIGIAELSCNLSSAARTTAARVIEDEKELVEYLKSIQR